MATATTQPCLLRGPWNLHFTSSSKHPVQLNINCTGSAGTTGKTSEWHHQFTNKWEHTKLSNIHKVTSVSGHKPRQQLSTRQQLSVGQNVPPAASYGLFHHATKTRTFLPLRFWTDPGHHSSNDTQTPNSVEPKRLWTKAPDKKVTHKRAFIQLLIHSLARQLRGHLLLSAEAPQGE